MGDIEAEKIGIIEDDVCKACKRLCDEKATEADDFLEGVCPYAGSTEACESCQ